MAWRFDTGTEDPHEALSRIVAQVRAADDDQLGPIGAGPLESLLFDNEEALWPEIERLARDDPRFRRALRGAWAYDSPKFDERDALLWELGEWTQVTVRFVGYRERVGSDAPLNEWRAVEVEGAPMEQVIELLADIVRDYQSEAIGPGDRDDAEQGVDD